MMTESDRVGTASFGYWVRRRRLALDLTQAALARRVGCATVTIKKIEYDERRPSRLMARRLAEQLGIQPEDHPSFIQTARGERPVDQLPFPTAPIFAGTSVGLAETRRKRNPHVSPRRSARDKARMAWPEQALPEVLRQQIWEAFRTAETTGKPTRRGVLDRRTRETKRPLTPDEPGIFLSELLILLARELLRERGLTARKRPFAPGAVVQE